MRTSLLIPCVATLVAVLAPATVDAATTQRSILQMAPGLCGANNPANDPYLRRLTNGLKNGGTTTVSVVCSLWGDSTATSYASMAYVYFKNDKTTGVNVNCTLSMGRPRDAQTAITRSTYVAAGAVASTVWTNADYGNDANKQWVNLQCSLPSGVVIREIGADMHEEIGT
jgi:hypothetical protein